jgi:hypothetical protein
MTKEYTNPLDFMLTEDVTSRPLFGESSVGEVTLPDEPITDEDFDFDNDAGGSDEGTEKLLGTLSDELDKIKNKITELKTEYPEDVNGEVAGALDDATSAIDLAVHHLSDIGEDLDTEKPLLDNEVPIEVEGIGNE